VQSPDAQCDLTHCAEHLTFSFSESTRTRQEGGLGGPGAGHTSPTLPRLMRPTCANRGEAIGIAILDH
jgi:hypothetical protein